MRFGIYPGGRAGTVCSRPDDPDAVERLIDELAPDREFVIREYVHYLGDDPDPQTVASIGAGSELDHLTLPDAYYARPDRRLDLVVSYLPPAADLDGWLRFLDRALDRYGHLLGYLQVTLEPNFPVPLIDGSSPGVHRALVEGLRHARKRAGCPIGFSVAEPPEWLGGDEQFWAGLGPVDIDYIGIALYPDAFSPVDAEHVGPMTDQALEHLRNHSLPTAGIPKDIPVHVAENGSPRAASLARMLDVIVARGDVAVYEQFGLRDADSGASEPVGRLGLVTDDYRPKPAFQVYRDVIASNAARV
jgi:hypothetical protein